MTIKEYQNTTDAVINAQMLVLHNITKNYRRGLFTAEESNKEIENVTHYAGIMLQAVQSELNKDNPNNYDQGI